MSKLQVNVIKVGGNIIDHEEKLTQFLKDFADLKGLKVLVHGGGKIATEISKGLGIETKMADGRRITDAETLKVVTMVYAGLINKNLTAHLQSLGCNGIGLTGADGNIIPAVKRPIKEIDYGFVGDVDYNTMKADALILLLENGLTPIIAPLTHNQQGSMLNTNADTIASSIAEKLSEHFEVKLIYCFEKQGVLNAEKAVIPQITPAYFQTLKATGVVHAGMIPKLENAFRAIERGVSSVFILNAENLTELINKKESVGTKIIGN